MNSIAVVVLGGISAGCAALPPAGVAGAPAAARVLLLPAEPGAPDDGRAAQARRVFLLSADEPLAGIVRLRPAFDRPLPAELIGAFAAAPGEPGDVPPPARTGAQILRVEQGHGPLPSAWDTIRRDIKDLPNELWDNTREIVFRPVPMIILVGTGAASIPVFKYVDPKVVDYYGGNNNAYPHCPPQWVRDAADYLGNPAHHAAAAFVMYGIGVAGDDPKFYDFSKSMLYALALNDLATGGMKLAINQKSPNGKAFGFPSGHTSSTICFASVIHQYYGPWAAAPFYGISVYVGWGRLWDREHRLSDVIYGAVLGLVVGHVVAGRSHARFLNMNIEPMIEPDARGGTITGIRLAGRF
jgi:membrane-associated phospholipid phosphatase